MNGLSTIKDAAVLSAEDFSFLESIAAELQDTLAKRQVFRTETEMHISVLNDIAHPTPASKYWQAVREQAVMVEQLTLLSFEYRRNQVKAARLQAKLKASTDEFEIAELQIDLDECEFKRASSELVAADRIREIRLWSGIKANLDDGSFDTKDVNTHQLASYTKQFILQASNAPEDMPVAEANNLIGQLNTSLRVMEARGELDSVLDSLPAAVKDRVFEPPQLEEK